MAQSPPTPRQEHSPEPGSGLSEGFGAAGPGFEEYEEAALLDDAARAERRTHLVVAAVALLLLAGGAVGTFFVLNRAQVTLRGEATYRYEERQAVLDVATSSNRRGQVLLRLPTRTLEQPLEAAEGRHLSFVVGFDDLPLGECKGTLSAVDDQGQPIAEQPVQLYRDFEVTDDLSGLGGSSPAVSFRFTIPEGFTVRAQGKTLTPADPVLPFSLSDLFANIDEQRNATYRLTLPITITRPDGSTSAAEHPVQIPLPTTELVVEQPHEEFTVTADADALFTGRTEPKAKLTVGGAAATVTAAGRFEVKVPLGGVASDFVLPSGATALQARNLAQEVAKKQGLEVEVAADGERKVAQAKYYNFLRVSPEAAERYRVLLGAEEPGTEANRAGRR